MAHTVKSPGAAGSAKEPPFEDALKRLESIVDTMEAGELPLDQLLARFEEGTRLVRLCQTKLEEAELKIQTLEQTATGETELKPLLASPED